MSSFLWKQIPSDPVPATAADENKDEIPLTEQILNFWQFTKDDYKDSTPDIYFNDLSERLKRCFKPPELLTQYRVSSISSTLIIEGVLIVLPSKISDISFLFSVNLKALGIGHIGV